MKKLIPLGLMLIGIGGGVGAGLVLRPDAAATATATADEESAVDHGNAEVNVAAASHEAAPEPSPAHGGGAGGQEYIKFNNQFVVPIVDRDRVEAMIVMSLSLEVTQGQSDAVYLHEPKLRDAFLQVMFDHANMGGFSGVFTDTAKLDALRTGLKEVASSILGNAVTTVLITEFARQQM
jgi:hypothetical protein